MKTQLELEVEDQLAKVLEPSLVSDQKVSYLIRDNKKLEITVETDSLGPLRGATDTSFRLAMLGNKILQR